MKTLLEVIAQVDRLQVNYNRMRFDMERMRTQDLDEFWINMIEGDEWYWEGYVMMIDIEHLENAIIYFDENHNLDEEAGYCGDDVTDFAAETRKVIDRVKGV